MAQPAKDPQLVVRFERLKRDVKTVKSFEIDSSYMTSTDGWSVTLYDTDRSKLRGLELEPVEILLNDAQQVLGRVDVSEVGNDGSAVTLRGRDYLADMVECNVDPALALKQTMTLSDALVMALGPVGIAFVENDADLRIRNIRTGKTIAAPAAKDFKGLQLEDLKPNPGQGLFEFCNRLVARFGATMQPALSRDTICLASPNYKQDPVAKLFRSADPNKSTANNIISASATRDFSSFPTYALFTGKGGKPGDAKSSMSSSYDFGILTSEFGRELARATSMVSTGRKKPGETNDVKQGQLYRLLYHRDDDSRNAAQLETAAKRAIAERLKDTLSYRVTLRGFTDPASGALWATDTIVQVTDEICGIDEPLWVEKRTFRATPNEGAVTELELWRPESFQIG